jgi:thiol reductant ABC exporter CydD subunit
VLLGIATALLVVAQAWLLSSVIATAFGGRFGLSHFNGPLALLVLVILARVTLVWFSERTAHKASAVAKSELRLGLARAVASHHPLEASRRPTEPGQSDSAKLATLATRGIDALDGYFSRYLPQVLLAVIVPLAVIAVVAGLDWTSALILAVTVPLVPLFLVLVGSSTKEVTDRQLHDLQRLARRFLDLVAGLPTLKVFGRAKATAAAIGEMTERYRRAAMATLKVAFLSSLVLELVSTLSVALVAVALGLRLVSGGVDLRTALVVLVLAPEVYLPLRQLGASYHDSVEGMRAAGQILDHIEVPSPPEGTITSIPDLRVCPLRIRDVQVTYPGHTAPALGPVSLELAPRELLALVGPSGCGKSTLLRVLLRLVGASSGSVHVGTTDLCQLDAGAWRSHVAWVPQRPHLFARSIADNVALARPDATTQAVTAALSSAGLSDVVADLPQGMNTVLGEGGAGLSAGERQRVALARAFLCDAALLLLDEPTANLDGATEAGILSSLEHLVAGRTVLMVAHRPALVAMADRVVRLDPSMVGA